MARALPHGILYAMEDREEMLAGLPKIAPLVAQIDAPKLELVAENARDKVTIIATTGGKGASGDLIRGLPNLELIACWGTGYENVDLDAARARNVRVSYNPGANAASVADLAVGLLIDSVRRVSLGDRIVRGGRWPTEGKPSPPARGMTGRKIGILGLGAIGYKIALRLAGFESEIVYHSRRPRADAPWRYFADFHEMALYCDTLMIALRADASNRHIVDARILDALGPEAHVVNITRGSAIDEDALIAALKAKRIAGAGLDVFQREPDVPQALRDLDNVVLTPHLGGGALESVFAMSKMLMDNVAAYVRDGTLISPVPEFEAAR
jgi:lactate dehydrogenase-like 2-hydroxyacid dehydrogenase